MRERLGWLGQVVSWLVILGVLAALVAAVLVPRLAGATPYTVLSGSMRPTYPEGTLVIVRPGPVDEIGTGDVITYQLESGVGTVATHRVVSISTTMTGETRFTTRGDANDAPDREPVRPVQVRGEVWYAIPYLGHVNSLLTGKERQVAVYVVAALLLTYAAAMVASAARDRRRERQGVA